MALRCSGEKSGISAGLGAVLRGLGHVGDGGCVGRGGGGEEGIAFSSNEFNSSPTGGGWGNQFKLEGGGSPTITEQPELPSDIATSF